MQLFVGSITLACLFLQLKVCGEDEDTQAQDDDLSIRSNELPQGSDCGESFTLEMPGQPLEPPLNLNRSLNPHFGQPPLDFLDPDYLPR